MELPFAGLQQLCAPLLGGLDALPEPAARRAQDRVRAERRRPAGSLPGRDRGAEPARGAADLEQITVDFFVFGGAWGRRAATVGARRVGRLPACPRWSGAWGRAAAGRLSGLRVHPRADWTLQVRDRIVAETRGNPPGAAGAPARSEPGGAGGRLRGCSTLRRCRPGSRRSFQQRRRRAPRRVTRLLLLVAAADADRRSVLVWSAAEAARDQRGRRAAPPPRAGLLELGARVHFRHPLVRSGVYRGASIRDRPARRSGARRTRPIPSSTRIGAPGIARTPWRGSTRRSPRARALRRAGAGPRRSFAAAAAFLDKAAALTRPARAPARQVAAAQAKLARGASTAPPRHC